MTDEPTLGHDSSQMHIPGMDLGMGLVYLLLTISLVMYVDEPITRTLVGLPLILFVPGYTLLLALYPHKYLVEEYIEGWFSDPTVEGPVPAGTRTAERGIKLSTRLALSFGLSLGLLAPLAIALALFGFGFTLETLLGSLSVFATVTLVIGSMRRKSLPEEERFSLPFEQYYSDMSAWLFNADTRLDTTLNIALAVTVILAMTGFTYALAVPNYGEEYTEFSLVQQNDAGSFVFADYPTDFVQGVPQELYVAIENKEGATTDYTVVVELQRVETGDGTLTVVEREELNRFAALVANDRTWYQSHSLTPTMTGDHLRLSYMLYKGDVPANPTEDNAYRHLYLWVNVTAAN
ncbi:DUF1616 domain-containing protein [Haladaptatus sp. CMSO5]|uniref:DUF1616 domain-containing protein n=1 Tax=Haladaptatus sp. CMSO5 TaxID=3120514 RepID=UPI002FCDF742